VAVGYHIDQAYHFSTCDKACSIHGCLLVALLPLAFHSDEVLVRVQDYLRCELVNVLDAFPKELLGPMLEEFCLPLLEFALSGLDVTFWECETQSKVGNPVTWAARG
jgi:hypothetical protein